MSDALAEYVWWNGSVRPWAEATIHASALGAASVGAVFEGIRGYASPSGGVLAFRLDDHLRRLGDSMRLMRMTSPWDGATLATACSDLFRANGFETDVYLRPMAWYAPSYRPTFELGDGVEVLITASGVPAGAEAPPIAAGVSSYRRIRDDVMPPRVKNLSNYRNGQLAHTEVSLGGYDTALLLNAAGEVTEGTAACVFLVRGGTVITPDVASGVLEGITRDTLLTLFRSVLGLPVEVRRVDRTELYLADEIFLAGTMAEVAPIGSVDRYVVGDGSAGPVTRAVRSLYGDVVRGAVPEFGHWVTRWA